MPLAFLFLMLTGVAIRHNVVSNLLMFSFVFLTMCSLGDSPAIDCVSKASGSCRGG